MIRLKIKSMAEDRGYSLGQYLFVALFNRVSTWSESGKTHEENMVKFEALFKLTEIIKKSKKLTELEDVIDFRTFTRLRRDKN
jgi:hypothetical protein